MLFSMCGCKNDSHDLKNLKAIITENGFDNKISLEALEIMSSTELDGNTEGLSRGSYVLLLLSGSTALIDTPVPQDRQYRICAVDFESEKIALFEYGDYFPLTVINDFYIQYANARIQEQNFNIISTYIKEYGFNFAKNEDLADMYIRRITGTNGFIPLSEAQGLIDGALPSLFENDDFDRVQAVFEDGSAVPTAYECITEGEGENIVITLDRDFTELFTEHKADIENDEPRPGDEGYEYDEYRFVEEDEHPANTGAETQNGENAPSDTMYRVRKSANDSKSQLGAFSSLDNAKKLAKEKKSEGYKVFDGSGKLVYTP